jgi:hypothetical protein
MYCKIERGDRQAKRKQSQITAEILQAEHEEVLTFCLVDHVTADY